MMMSQKQSRYDALEEDEGMGHTDFQAPLNGSKREFADQRKKVQKRRMFLKYGLVLLVVLLVICGVLSALGPDHVSPSTSTVVGSDAQHPADTQMQAQELIADPENLSPAVNNAVNDLSNEQDSIFPLNSLEATKQTPEKPEDPSTVSEETMLNDYEQNLALNAASHDSSISNTVVEEKPTDPGSVQSNSTSTENVSTVKDDSAEDNVDLAAPQAEESSEQAVDKNLGETPPAFDDAESVEDSAVGAPDTTSDVDETSEATALPTEAEKADQSAEEAVVDGEPVEEAVEPVGTDEKSTLPENAEEESLLEEIAEASASNDDTDRSSDEKRFEKRVRQHLQGKGRH